MLTRMRGRSTARNGYPKSARVTVSPAPAASWSTRARLISPWPRGTKIPSLQELEEFARKLPELVDELRGPGLTARENKDCERCPIRSICPIMNEGGLVTNA